tara:strand:- start:1474 stop:2175 length:702 start_codon:yes stop_codon:yes gene_type:complete
MSGFIGASNSRDGVIDRSQPLGKVDNPTFVAPTFTGAAVLGTPASGVVTNLSGVLPSGVTGGSGLTALGTVTQGNLANTSIVYPNGHILFTDSTTLNGVSTSSTATSYTTTGNTITVASANVALGSKISISFTHGFEIQQGSSEARIDYRLQRTAPSASTIENNLYALGNRGTGNPNYLTTVAGTALDTSLGSGDHIYQLQFRKANGTAAQCGAIGYNWYIGAVHQMIAMVIK